MTFLDAFNGWSALHLLGSFILTTTLGTTSLGPIQVGLISFGLGAGWEILADQELRLNDPRGGDYYDLLWDFAGCAAGALALELTADTYRSDPSLWPRLAPESDRLTSMSPNQHHPNQRPWALHHPRSGTIYPINIHRVDGNFSLGVRWQYRTFSGPGTNWINQDTYALLAKGR